MFITNCISFLNERISEKFSDRKAAWFVFVVVAVQLTLLLKRLLVMFLEKLISLVSPRDVIV